MVYALLWFYSNTFSGPLCDYHPPLNLGFERLLVEEVKVWVGGGDTYSVLAEVLHGGAPVTPAHLHETVEGAPFAMEPGAVGLDLAPAVEHDLGA